MQAPDLPIQAHQRQERPLRSLVLRERNRTADCHCQQQWRGVYIPEKPVDVRLRHRQQGRAAHLHFHRPQHLSSRADRLLQGYCGQERRIWLLRRQQGGCRPSARAGHLEGCQLARCGKDRPYLQRVWFLLRQFCVAHLGIERSIQDCMQPRFLPGGGVQAAHLRSGGGAAQGAVQDRPGGGGERHREGLCRICAGRGLGQVQSEEGGLLPVVARMVVFTQQSLPGDCLRRGDDRRRRHVPHPLHRPARPGVSALQPAVPLQGHHRRDRHHRRDALRQHHRARQQKQPAYRQRPAPANRH